MSDPARQVIDAQFDRAVKVVQGLSKTGPIQTGYEEKLAMYSLFKQATVGNVKGPRPALWDMLGRAKWDAWSKRKDVDSYQAKWLYVDELLKVLRKPEYNDVQLANELVAELEAFGTSVPDFVPSGSVRRKEEDESSSSDSESETDQQRRLSHSFQNLQQQQQRRQMQAGRGSSNVEGTAADDEDEDDDSSDTDDDDDVLPEGYPQRGMHPAQSQVASTLGRPPSSMSTNRYRTPLGGSMVMSPPLPPSTGPAQSRQRPQTMFVHPQAVQHLYSGLPRPESDPTMSAHMLRSHQLSAAGQQQQSLLSPEVQPMPNYETPSAFAAPGGAAMSASVASSSSPHHIVPGGGDASSSSLTSNFGVISVPGSGSTALLQHPYPANMYPGHPAYRVADPGSLGSHVDLTNPTAGLPGAPFTPMGGSGVIRSALERAVESMQAHLAAMQERMDALELRTRVLSRSGDRSPHDSSSFGGRYNYTGGSPLASPYNSRAFLSSDGVLRGAVSRWWDFDQEYFDWEHMGLWSVVLAPLARLTKFLSRIVLFLLARREREGLSSSRLSPGLIILRRLLLDASFVLSVLFIGRKIWKKSGVRRNEVVKALRGVWTAVMGSSVVAAPARILVDKAV